MTSTLGRDLTLYTVARFALIGAITGLLLLLDVPLVFAIAVAAVLGLPLGLVLFRGLNQRVTTGLAERNAAARTAREQLRAELRGGSAPATERDGS